jgi:hypothetical protein
MMISASACDVTRVGRSISSSHARATVTTSSLCQPASECSGAQARSYDDTVDRDMTPLANTYY